MEDSLGEESLWIQKSENTLQVDSKKLEKAEQQLQKKLARQQGGGGGERRADINNIIIVETNQVFPF